MKSVFCKLLRTSVFWELHVFSRESRSSEVHTCLRRIAFFWGPHVSPENCFRLRFVRVSPENYECLLRIVVHKCLLRITRCLVRISVFWGSHVSPANYFLVKCTLPCENYECLLKIVAHKCILRIVTHKCSLRIPYCLLRITIFWGSHVSPEKYFLLRFVRVSRAKLSSEVRVFLLRFVRVSPENYECLLRIDAHKCLLEITRCLVRISVFWGSHVSPENSFLLKCTLTCEKYECLLKFFAHKCILRTVLHKYFLRIPHCLLRICVFWGSHVSPENQGILRVVANKWLQRIARVFWDVSKWLFLMGTAALYRVCSTGLR